MRKANVLLLPAISLEAVSFYSFLSFSEIWPFLISHLASSLFAVGWCLNFIKENEQKNLPIYWLSFWFFLPGIGCFVAGVITFLLRDRISPRGDAMEVLTELVDSEKGFFKDLSLKLLAEKYQKAESVESIYDVLRSNQFEEKRKVISSLRKTRTPDAIRFLKIAQSDSSYEIQYLATVALTTIEQDWLEDLKKVTREMEASPKDPNLRVQILEKYYHLYSSGVVSESISKIYLSQAHEISTESVSIISDNVDLTFQHARVLAYLKKSEEARDLLLSLIEKEKRMGWIEVLLKVYHDVGDREALQRLSNRTLVDHPPGDSESLKDKLLFWSEIA